MITQIYDRGLAYESEGSVYFDLAKYQAEGNKYGRLVNVDFTPQARVDNDEYDKNEARDFVLWKAAKDGEPYWDFSLGALDLPGRPGWHIECSAMALENLHAQPITIHSGGIDLRFPHHENEIAQTVGATGNDFTHIFTHHGHLFIDGKRMGKSMGNAYTLADVVAKGFSPLSLRVMALQAGHTAELNFTWDSLEAAQNTLGNLYAWADLRHQTNLSELRLEPTVIEDVVAKFNAALADDLNSAAALAELFRFSLSVAPGMRYDDEDTTEILAAVDQLFGLRLSGRPDITPELKELIAARTAAKEQRDYATSDRLRAQLERKGIGIGDTPNGPRWTRLNL